MLNTHSDPESHRTTLIFGCWHKSFSATLLRQYSSKAMSMICGFERAVRLIKWTVGKSRWILLDSTLHQICTSSWTFQIFLFSLWTWWLHKNCCSNGLDVTFSMTRMYRDPALCFSVSQSFVSPLTNEQMLAIVSSTTCQGEAGFSASQNFCDFFAVLFLPHCFCSISVALKQCVISVLWNRSLCCNQSAKLEVDNYCCKWQKIE